MKRLSSIPLVAAIALGVAAPSVVHAADPLPPPPPPAPSQGTPSTPTQPPPAQPAQQPAPSGSASASASASSASSSASNDEPSSRAGLAERDAWLLGMDNVFGFMQQKLKFDNAGITEENLGVLPPLTGMRASVHHVWQGGLTIGSQLSLAHVSPRHDGDGVTEIYLGPRVGYMGNIPRAPFGFWVRGGPSLFDIVTKNGAYSIDLSAEVNAVLRLGPTIMVLFGFGLDIPLTGKATTSTTVNGNTTRESSVDFSYSSLGFGFGFMAEL